jgi:hypothetical protein
MQLYPLLLGLLHPEDEGTQVVLNVGNYLSNDKKTSIFINASVLTSNIELLSVWHSSARSAI